jgi:hypothetical protein
MRPQWVRPLLHILVYSMVWFSFAGINHFAAMLFVSIPVFWVFVFFPAMTLNWGLGLTVISVFGLLVESQFTVFQGGYLPACIGLFLYLQYRRAQIFDWNFKHYLVLASISHLWLVTVMSLMALLNGKLGSWEIFVTSVVTDWLLGQMLVPLLVGSLLFVLGRTDYRANYNPELNELR